MKKLLIIISLFIASNVGATYVIEEELPPLDCSNKYFSYKEKRDCLELNKQRELDRELAIQRQIEQEEKARFEKEQFERLEAEQKEKEEKVETQEKEIEEMKKLIIELQLKVIELIKELIAKNII